MAPRAAACQARARPGFAVPHVTTPITQAAPVGTRATHGLSLAAGSHLFLPHRGGQIIRVSRTVNCAGRLRRWHEP